MTDAQNTITSFLKDGVCLFIALVKCKILITVVFLTVPNTNS